MNEGPVPPLDWPFDDPPNVAVITIARILSGDPICLVTHDADDGCWQFLPYEGAPDDESEARIVGLSRMLKLDASLAELADLPCGRAWREPGGPWQRSRKTSEE